MCSVLEICVVIAVCHMYRDVLPIFMYINTKYRTSNPSVTLGVVFFCRAVNMPHESERCALCVKTQMFKLDARDLKELDPKNDL